MASFHITNYGSFGNGFTADIDGYVYTTTSEVLSGCWDEADGRMTRQKAAEIARENREAMREADAALAEWREGR